MGYHTLLVVSHDQFDQTDNGLASVLGGYVRNASSEQAKILDLYTHSAVKVISTRHSGDEAFYVSNQVPGFPTRLPYDEQLDEENAAWEAAAEKARAWLGKTLKLRTMAQLRDLVIKLITKHKTAEAQILAGDGAFFARRKLQDTNWQPRRSDYEALKNRLAKIEETLGETA